MLAGYFRHCDALAAELGEAWLPHCNHCNGRRRCDLHHRVAIGRTDPSNPNAPVWLYMIRISVTLAVAAILEGIPLCVTISLSIRCSDMVKQNVLVRKLAAVETLGSALVICIDKTGTLTEGR